MMRPKVLVVEDNEDNRCFVRQLMEMLDVTLVEAANGLEAVQLARDEAPAVILMDLSLPVMNGWEAAAALKADPATAKLPIIALTAHAMAGDEEKARAAGCDEYVTKPVDIARLFAVLGHYLGGKTP